MTIKLELPDLEDDLELPRDARYYVQLLADMWFKTPKRIVLTCLLLTVCISIIGWNLSRFSVIDELIYREIEEFELKNQLSDLELQISALDLDALGEEIDGESDRIFQGFPELAVWTQSLSNIAHQSGVIMTYRVDVPHMSPVPDTLEVPLSLEFKALPESADTLFAQSTKLVSTIVRDHWHIDVVAANASGSGKQLETVSIRAHVWVRDRFGFVDAATLTTSESGQAFTELQ